MAIKINFDSANVPENPTFNLANRSGNKLGLINAKNIVVKDCMNSSAEVSFTVNKYVDGKLDKLWSKIRDFKLVYCKEIDMWFEATVSIDESNETIKNVSCVQLGQAELSQIILHNIEINTEDDPNWDKTKATDENYEYKRTILCDEEDHSTSLLHRLMEKAQHYHLVHVDSTIAKIQRTFSFNNKSIYDAFQEIAEEINCLFVFHSDTDENGKIRRGISVYDLEQNCLDCGHRGEFNGVCPKCGSKNITDGYGVDTTIFVTSDELGKNIQLQTDTDSTKNCFKLEAGDDLMTATIRNCNPNGSDYIWYISDDVKEDMSDELVTKLNTYNDSYRYYQNESSILLNETLTNRYNDLVDKYKVSNKSLEKITSPVVGYANLMTTYYKTIDMALYLQSGLLPNVELSSTDATKEASKLNSSTLSSVSVSSTKNISLATANNAVLSMAKCLVNSNYKVKVNNSFLSGLVWVGDFTITNYSDEEDTSTSNRLTVIINEDYQKFVYQKLQKVLSTDDGDATDIVGLFDMELSYFVKELKKYNLDSLNIFWDMAQSCIDILIEQGIADKESWNGSNKNLYDDLYLPYFNKLKAIELEQKNRQDELDIVLGIHDADGNLVQEGVQTVISEAKENIQKNLNFEEYLGRDLWLEFCAYRREDTYSNNNYISDGLNNAELFSKALEFIGVAEKEIYKSSELQHSISSTLQNLLVIDKFKPLVHYFEVGNWFRIQVDDKVYKLRLLEYEIDYNNLDDLSVTFSDVMKTADGYSDQVSILKQASSMATSYDSVQRQASQGSKSKDQLDDIVSNGLALTKTKIIDNADNQNITWDSHGLLGREYLPITDSYSDKQLKIINKGLYLTDDGWLTSRAGIGNFSFYNPKTKQIEEAYGVIADKLIGNLVLSEDVGIFNENNSVSIDKDGFNFTANTYGNTIFNIQRENANGGIDKLLYLDDKGNLVLNGSFKIQSTSSSSSDSNKTFDDIMSDTNSKVDNSIKSIETEYYVSTSMTELVGGSWQSTSPEWEDGKYIWSRTKTTPVVGVPTYSKPVCISGNNGKDGESTLSVQIESSNGNIFMKNNIQTTLTCKVYYGIEDVTNQVKQFTWKKIDQDGNVDESWNRIMSGNVITLTEADVLNRASFTCSVDIDI